MIRFRVAGSGSGSVASAQLCGERTISFANPAGTGTQPLCRAGPASIRHTRCRPDALSLAASTQPAVPPPAIT